MAAPDFTGDYNTKLSAEDEKAFQSWLSDLGKKDGRDRARDLADYDMRGFFKSGGAQAGDGHFTDKFKKPSHPTFSDQSIYHGTDGHEGGKWDVTDDGRDRFTPGPANLKHYTPAELKKYWKDIENDDVELVLPGEVGMFPNSNMMP